MRTTLPGHAAAQYHETERRAWPINRLWPTKHRPASQHPASHLPAQNARSTGCHMRGHRRRIPQRRSNSLCQHQSPAQLIQSLLYLTRTPTWSFLRLVYLQVLPSSHPTSPLISIPLLAHTCLSLPIYIFIPAHVYPSADDLF